MSKLLRTLAIAFALILTSSSVYAQETDRKRDGPMDENDRAPD